MSKDLIGALEEAVSSLNYIANTACKRDEELMSDAINVRGYARSRAKAASEALSRHRSSVESVELPWAECWVDGGDLEQLGKLGMGGVLGWPDNGNDPRRVPLYTASTVRSLIAAAVEREREEVTRLLEGLEGFVGVREVAAAIRARGEK